MTHADQDVMVFVCIWQDWTVGDENFTTCAIVRTDANAAMAFIQCRLPVILTPDQWALWLGDQGKGAAKVMKSAPEDALSFTRMSTDVNSNRTSGPELIEAFEDP